MADYTSKYTGEEIEERLDLAGTSVQPDELEGKQDKIDDLAEIREGAEKGASALQPTDISEWAKSPEKPTYSAEEVGAYNKAQVDDKLSILATKGELGTLAQIVSNKADSSVVEDIAEEVEKKADKSELSALDEKVETTRLATDLSNLDADGRGVIEGIAKERVFVATYGVTTYDDILNAYNDGKEVKMISGSYIYRVSQFAPEQNVVRFNSLNTEISRMAQVTSENRWSVFTYLFEKTDHRQNVLTESETNYPSSKGVIDYVAEQTRDFVKVTPTLTSGTKIADVESGGSVVPLYAPNGSGGSEWHSVLLTEADYNEEIKGFRIEAPEGYEIAEAIMFGQCHTSEPSSSTLTAKVGYGDGVNQASTSNYFSYWSVPANNNYISFYVKGESAYIGLNKYGNRSYSQGGYLRYQNSTTDNKEINVNATTSVNGNNITQFYWNGNNPKYFQIHGIWNSVDWAKISIQYRLRAI